MNETEAPAFGLWSKSLARERERQRLKDAVVAAAMARHQYYEAKKGQDWSVELADAEWKAVRALLEFEQEQEH